MPEYARIEVRGMKELRKTMKAAGDDLADIKTAHHAAGSLVVDVARGYAPTVSGSLSGSIRASRLAGGVEVKAGSARIPYANPIHWGWAKRNIEGSFFLTQAAADSEPQWFAFYEEELDKILDRVKGDTA